MTRLALSLFLLLGTGVAQAAPGATTGTLEGTLKERALMKSVQVVYLEKVEGAEFTKPTEGATMNQKGNTYVPHILPVVTGAKVAFQTQDPELHNIYAKTGETVMFNTALPSGAPAYYKSFNTPGIVALTCNIHSEMSAFILVLQNKFFAQPDPKTGTWKVDGIPAGTYDVKIWGEKLDDALKGKAFSVKVLPGASTTLEISGHSAI